MCSHKANDLIAETMMENQAITEKPSLNQLSTFIDSLIKTNESINEVFETDNAYQYLSEMSLAQYNRFLALNFNNKIMEFKKMLDQLGLPRIKK